MHKSDSVKTMTLMQRAGMACLPDGSSWRGDGGDRAGGHGGEAGEDVAEIGVGVDLRRLQLSMSE